MWHKMCYARASCLSAPVRFYDTICELRELSGGGGKTSESRGAGSKHRCAVLRSPRSNSRKGCCGRAGGSAGDHRKNLEIIQRFQ